MPNNNDLFLDNLERDLFLGDANKVLETIKNHPTFLAIDTEDISNWNDYSARLMLLFATAKKDIGDLDIANQYALLAFKYFSKNTDANLKYLGDTELLFTSINRHHNVISSAWEHGYKAKSFYEKARDEYRLARLLNYQGVLYFYLGLYSRALSVINESLEILNKLKIKKIVSDDLIDVTFASATHMKGVVLHNDPSFQDNSKPGELFKEAKEKLGNKSDKVKAYIDYDFAKHYLKKGDFPSSEKHLNYCIETRREKNDNIGIAYATILKAKWALKKGKEDTAIKIAEEVDELEEDKKSDTLQCEIYEVLARAYKQSKKPNSVEISLNYFEKYVNLSQSLENTKLGLLSTLMKQDEKENHPDIENHNLIMKGVHAFYTQNEVAITNLVHNLESKTLPIWIDKTDSKSADIQNFAQQTNNLIKIAATNLIATIGSHHCPEIWNIPTKSDKETEVRRIEKLLEALIKEGLITTNSNKKEINPEEFTWHFIGKENSLYSDTLIWKPNHAPSLLLLYYLLFERGYLIRDQYIKAKFKIIYSNWQPLKGSFRQNAFSNAADRYKILHKNWKDEAPRNISKITHYDRVRRAVDHIKKI